MAIVIRNWDSYSDIEKTKLVKSIEEINSTIKWERVTDFIKTSYFRLEVKDRHIITVQHKAAMIAYGILRQTRATDSIVVQLCNKFHLDYLAVTREKQEQAWGTKMMKEIFDFIQTCGEITLTLHSQRDRISFYFQVAQHLGLTITIYPDAISGYLLRLTRVIKSQL